MGYAFISYSTKNQASADAMRELFNKHNIDTWMAPYDIPAGSKYAAVITKAIRDCSCFVLLLSNDSQASEAVDSEVELATLTFKKSIITVELEKVILNDAFTFYIHNKQIIAVHKIDEKSYEVKQVLDAVKAYTQKVGKNDVAIDDVQDQHDKETLTKNEDKPFIDTNAGRMILDGRYELRNMIGQGGFGTVYKAMDLQNQKIVAVKIGNITDRNVIDLHRSLIGEDNEYLCQVYDASISSNGESYIVMEWFDEGKSLLSIKDYREFIKGLGEDYPNGGHILLLINILKGLRCLHAKGVVHADINPSNILTDGFRTKLMDYSSAFYANAGTNLGAEHTYIVGSYGSPEEKKDFRSDLYSVGMVAFRWLTGENPEVDEDGNLDFDNVFIDCEAKKILKKATTVNPINRYQSADEFIAALKKYLKYFLDNEKSNTNDSVVGCDKEEIYHEIADNQKALDDEKSADDTRECSSTDLDFFLGDGTQNLAKNQLALTIDDEIDSNNPKEKCKGHLVSSYRRAIVISQEDCVHPIEILMPDDTTKTFDFCDEFSVSNQKKYIVVRQKNESNEYLFFIFRSRNGKNTLISEGQDQKKVYRWFREKHADEYMFTDDKVVMRNERKKKHFAQDTAPRLFASVDEIPQILVLPDKYEHISANAFAKLNLDGKEIRQIIISDSVEVIEDNAFAGLVVTEAVHIPKSVRKTGHNAFTLKEGAYIYCEGNSYIHILGHDSELIKDVPFKRTGSNKTSVVLAELSASNGVTRIKSNTLPFSAAEEEVDELYVPNGICVIDRHALDNVKVKNRIIIPSSVTRIGDYAFDLMPDAYVECDENSYAYLYCKENGIRNSVDISNNYKSKGVCAYCGGRFSGLFKKKCSLCGKEKDY